MRYPASEKLEIIRLVDGSHLPIKRTLEKLGIPRTTFYRWYDRYLSLGEAGLEDRHSRPGQGLEPHPRQGTQADRGTGSGRTRVIATRTCGAVH